MRIHRQGDDDFEETIECYDDESISNTREAEKLRKEMREEMRRAQEEMNMAEIEISILSRQCLKQRISDLAQLAEVSQQWMLARNTQHAKIDWCFDVIRARTKLARLYP